VPVNRGAPIPTQDTLSGFVDPVACSQFLGKSSQHCRKGAETRQAFQQYGPFRMRIKWEIWPASRSDVLAPDCPLLAESCHSALRGNNHQLNGGFRPEADIRGDSMQRCAATPS